MPSPKQNPHGDPRRSPSSKRNPKRDARIALGLLLLGVVLAYSAVGGHGFTNFDDTTYVTENEVVKRGLTEEGVRWAFTEREYASNWHPLTWLSHMADVELFGLEPGGHHWVSVALHALTAALLLVFLRAATGRVWPSFFAAAFFAWHPLRVESVAWIAERKDVLSGLFFALTLLAYLHYARRPGVGRYALVCLAFAAGLMAKPMLVTAPFVLLLLDFWPLHRRKGGSRRSEGETWRRLVIEKVPLFLLSAGSIWMTLHAQSAATELLRVPLSLRAENALAAIGVYLWQSVWPAGLACFYPHPAIAALDPEAALRTPALAALGVVAAVSTVAWLARYRQAAVAVGWLWFLGMLVPVLGILQVGTQAHADRYTYLPQIGIGIAIAFGAATLLERRPNLRPVVVGSAAIVLAGFVALSWRQASFWRDPMELWQHALAVTTRNYKAHNNLGRLHATAGAGAGRQVRERELELARFHFEEALKVRPGKAPDPEAAAVQYNLAGVEAMEGRSEGALQRLRLALELNPDFAEARAQLGLELYRLGRDAAAVQHLRRAYQLDPSELEVANLLAWLLAASGDADVRDGATAVQLAEYVCESSSLAEPRFQETLAAAHAEAGSFDEAVRWQKEALRSAPPGAARRMRARLELYEAGKPYRGRP